MKKKTALEWKQIKRGNEKQQENSEAKELIKQGGIHEGRKGRQWREGEGREKKSTPKKEKER